MAQPLFDLARLSRASAWRELAPDFVLTDAPFDAGHDWSVGEAALAQARSSLRQDGYFLLKDVIDPASAQRGAELIQLLTAAGLPAPFALVYDHLWQVLGRLTPVLQDFLGAPPQILPDYWIWQLDGRYENAGWHWHRDDKFERRCFDDQGRPLILTVWLALTDATLENGCIQVLPRSFDTKDRDEMRRMVVPPERAPHVRALPAPAGSVLAWDMYALHRGGEYQAQATSPRISLGIYFQSPEIASLDGAAIARGDRLNLLDRLGIVSRMILRYASYYPFSAELLHCCRQWAAMYALAHKLPEVTRAAPPRA